MTWRTIILGRRRTVANVATVAGVVTWLSFLSLSILDASVWMKAISVALFGASWVICRILVEDVAERKAVEVDEYELGQRHAVRNAGYLAALGSMLVVFLVLIVAVNLAERGNERLLIQAPSFVFASFLMSAAIPSFLLAWRLRHQPRDTEA